MQTVSDAWKQTQKDMLLPEQFIEIEYSVTDPDVQGDGTASSNGEMDFATTEDILEKPTNSPLYATLEHNIWGLDGNMSLLEEGDNTGFVSEELSGEDGTFASVPVVSIVFSETHLPLVPGVSITWSSEYDEYATDYKVTVWNNGAVVSEHLYQNNTEVNVFADADIQGYDEITVEILKWSKPYRRARMSYFTMGMVKVYSKNDLMSYSHTQTADLLSGSLPKASITFSLDNTDGKWNPDNVEGAEQYLLERQMLKVKYGLKLADGIEWINAGTFYMSEWSTPMNGLEATFTARDVVEFMNGKYTGARKGTLFNIAFAALGLAEITDFYLDDSLQGISTDFSTDESEYTISEILQMVANAGRCVMYQDREGKIRIEPVDETLTDYVISKDVSFAHPEYDISKELKAVSVNGGMGYAENAVTGEVQTIDNPLITDTTVAQNVANWTKDVIKRRKKISGEFRADVRMDALDKVIVSSKYADKEVQITEVTYNFTGGFKGSYVGRVV
jgi:hypothetical protein